MNHGTILHITRLIGIGGTEKMICQICQATRGQFDRVILCAGDGGGLSAFDMYIDKYYPIDDMQNKKVTVMLKTLIEIKKIIDIEKVDVIHIHHRMAAMYIYILNFFYHKIIIYNGHTIHNDKKFLTTLILKKYNIIADGKKVQKNLIEFYRINPNHVTLICNTVEEFDGKIKEHPLLSHLRKEGNILIGNVGRLCQEKGQKFFIEAAEIVLKRANNVKFIIIGDGKDRGYLEQIVKDKKLESDILFLGFQKDIKNIILQLDILVLSSLLEGLPLTPMEAFSVGKAIIATNIDGTNELVENNVNGFLYEPQDIERLAELLYYTVKNPQMWSKLSQNAYKIYLKKYSFQVFCKNYITYYDEICRNAK